MKINVNAGHSYRKPGASGLLNEVKEARAVKDALIRELKARGHTVSDSTASESASNTVNDQVRKCNASGAEIAVSIHLNAGGGTGSEVFYDARSSKGKALAEKVAPALAASMGIKNRGAKPDTAAAVGSLGWCRNTTPPAILCEVCFVDNQTDYNAYTKAGAAAVAYAIANALVGGSSASGGASGGSSSGGSASGGSSSGKLKVDGSIGNATTKEWQRQLGTTVDGVISGQPKSNQPYIPNIYSEQIGTGGSAMARALQRFLNGKGGYGLKVDGYIGKATVTALQKWMRSALGYKRHAIDGVLGNNTAANVQNALNAGAFK